MNFDRVVFEQAKENLQLAEERRKRRFKQLQRSVRFTFPLLCGAAWLVFAKYGVKWTVLLVIIYLTFYVLALMFNNSASKIDYKQIFLTPVLKSLFPHLTYKPLDYHRMKTFDKSNLYQGTYDNFLGDDMFVGEVEGRRYLFSDLEVTRHSKNSANWNHSTVIFKGIFLNATLPDLGSDGFIVMPKPIPEPSKLAVVNLIRKLSPQRVEQPIDTGYPAFDDLFQLMTQDIGQTMQYLTVRRMNLLTALSIDIDQLNSRFPGNGFYPDGKTSEKISISLSVYGNQLYLAIRNMQLFDLPFNSDLTDSEELFNKSIAFIRLIDRFIASW